MDIPVPLSIIESEPNWLGFVVFLVPCLILSFALLKLIGWSFGLKLKNQLFGVLLIVVAGWLLFAFSVIFAACATKQCQLKRGIVSRDEMIQEFILAGCISYNNGCGSCNKDKNGDFSCTMKACSKYEVPQCNRYENK